MKKRLVSLALALALLCALAVPAAAQTANERLAAVTAQVKAVLSLNTDAYEEFYGDLDENVLAPVWYLEWYGQDGSLSVSATEEGKILNFYRRDEADSDRSGVFAPKFPGGDRAAARAAAQAFMNRVLTAGETITMEDQGVDRLGQTTYRFHGEVLLNGLPAGLSYSVSVRCTDNAVTNFYRDDLAGSVMGGIPSPTAKITEAQARAALRETLSLRLEYALSGDGSNRAVLRYLPEYGDEYYVDAASGKLVNLTELRKELSKGEDGTGANAPADAPAEDSAEPESAEGGSLNEVEQAGVAQLEGVLSRDELDAKVRALTALGLDRYSLSTVSYASAREADPQSEDGNGVTASLRYGRQVNGASWRRTVTVDAKTGGLIRVSSSNWMPDEGVERKTDAAAAKKQAEAFLNGQCAGQFAKTALYDSYDALESEWSVSHSFTYAQQANGYFYPGNSIYVGVDATDGSISSYSRQFDDAVTFDSPDGILTMEQAIDAWLATYDVPLGYVQVPTAIDYSKPEYAPLLDYGIAYLYRLALGYGLEREDYYQGIDAKTGRPVQPDWAAEDDGLSYTDTANHWARTQIETLARYGVGYRGGAFRPNAAMTQLDMVALLVSTDGYLYDPAGEGAADRLYDIAHELGILSREERNDGAILSRMDAVRLILNAAGYGPVARLQGIYRTSFADDAAIPAAGYGYAALAQGLGVVNGAPGGLFQPAAATTRAQGAVMLYNLMSR